MKKVLFFILIVLFLFCSSGHSEQTEDATNLVNEVEMFEDLNWQLLYPNVILEDAAAWVDLSAGALVDFETGPGFFVEIEPGMHFLIFDGKFHIRLEQDNDPFGSFIKIKNEQVSDYFIETKVRYKELTFYFGDKYRNNSEMVFYPRVDFNRKYVSFDYKNNDWNLFVKSPEWSSWTFVFDSPALKLGPMNVSLSADAFLDNSASLTYAVSIGPELSFDRFSIKPFAGFEHMDKFPDELKEDTSVEGRQDFLFGAGGSFKSDVFNVNAGVKYSDKLYPFATVQLGPLEISAGKNLFLANEFKGIKEWTDVYWNLEEKGVNAEIGFSYEKNHLEEINVGVFADFEFEVFDDFSVDFSAKKTRDWLFELGLKYKFKLDFYAETDVE